MGLLDDINTDISASYGHIWHRSGYIPYKKQKEFHSNKKRYRAFIGGVASGKTIAGAAEAIRLGLEQPGARFLICAPNFPMLKRSTLVEFMRFIDDDMIEYFNKADMEMKLKNGSLYWFVSLDDPDKASRGQTVAGVWVDEGSYITEYGFKLLIGRMRQPGYEHSMWITTTPKGYNYLWKYFVDLPTKDPKYADKYWYIRSSSKDNPFLSADYIESLEMTMTGSFGQQEIEGEFIGFEGAVYPMFVPTTHVSDYAIKKDLFKSVLYGVDWGFNNPTCILAICLDSDDNMYVVEEVYQSGLTIDDIISKAHKLKEKWGEGVFVCDPSGAANIEAFSRAGLYAVKANNAILEGIQAVSARLTVRENGIPRLMVDRSCLNFINEMTNYRYPDPKDGKPGQERPVPIDDHSQDAGRYAVMHHDRMRTKMGVLNLSSLDDVI